MAYNSIRDWDKDQFGNGGHAVGWWWKGNTAGVAACDGTLVYSDGYFAWADI